MTKNCRKGQSKPCDDSPTNIPPTLPAWQPAQPATENVVTPSKSASTVTVTPRKTSLGFTKTSGATDRETKAGQSSRANELSSTVRPTNKLTVSDLPGVIPRSDQSKSETAAIGGVWISFHHIMIMISAIAAVCFLCALVAVIYACRTKKRSRQNKRNVREGDGDRATYMAVGDIPGLSSPRDSTTDNPTYAEIGGNGGVIMTLPPSMMAMTPSRTEQQRPKVSRLTSQTLPLIANEGFTDYPRGALSPTLPPPRQTYQELDVQSMSSQNSRTLSPTLSNSSRIYQIDDNVGCMSPTKNRNEASTYLDLIPEDQPTLEYHQIGGTISQPPKGGISPSPHVQTYNEIDDQKYVPLVVAKPASTGEAYMDLDMCHTGKAPGPGVEGKMIPTAPASEGALYFTLENQDVCPVNKPVPADPDSQDYCVLENDIIPSKVINQSQNNGHIGQNYDTEQSESRDYFILEQNVVISDMESGETKSPGANGAMQTRPRELKVVIDRKDPPQKKFVFSKLDTSVGESDITYCKVNKNKQYPDEGSSGYQRLPLLSPSEDDKEVYSKLNRGFMLSATQK